VASRIVEVNYHGGPDIVSLLERCRELRRAATDAESLLWRLLRNRQVAGRKFRRQHAFGPYILDFYCPERKLVVEADGGQHFEPGEAAREARRTEYLAARGLRILRFTNVEVLKETESVVEAIWWEVVGRDEEPSP
jgi:very-short-patch-repair endonuclease